MTCPACSSTMWEDCDCWNCPHCRGQFYTAAGTGGIEDLAWRRSMDLYYKAMRDSLAVDRTDSRYGFGSKHLRTMGRERESWEAGMYIR